jgi:hypothetical protein
MKNSGSAAPHRTRIERISAKRGSSRGALIAGAPIGN